MVGDLWDTAWYFVPAELGVWVCVRACVCVFVCLCVWEREKENRAACWWRFCRWKGFFSFEKDFFLFEKDFFLLKMWISFKKPPHFKFVRNLKSPQKTTLTPVLSFFPQSWTLGTRAEPKISTVGILVEELWIFEKIFNFFTISDHLHQQLTTPYFFNLQVRFGQSFLHKILNGIL